MPAKGQDKSSEPLLVYVVCGAENFLKREAISPITEQVLGDADRSLALSEYDGSTASAELANVLDDLRTLPFLSARRLVIIRDADSFLTRYRSELEDYVDNPSPTGVLLIECRSFPATTRLYKKIRGIGEITKCEPMNVRQVPGWLTTRCSSLYGMRLDRRAAAMLCDLTGTDLGLLDGELQKLSLYVGRRREITTEDVEVVTGQYREEKVWGILSAMAAGNESQALNLWEDVWQTDRAASARGIAGIAFTVRRLLNAKRAQEAGAPVRELTRILWCDEQRAQRELSAFSTSRLENMLCRLLEADVAGKTGLASVRSSIERFIVETCQGRRARRATG